MANLCFSGRWMAGFFLILMTLLQAGCGQSPQLQQFDGLAQGTTYHISWWGAQPMDNTALEQAVNQEFARIDAAISSYRDDSTLARFDANPSTETQEVGSEIVGLVEQARSVHLASHGCYDLTIKPLFDLWGFMGDRLTPPGEEALQQAMADVGMGKLETLDTTRLRKQRPGVRIDLSSIGQGYSVGRIAQLLQQRGIEHFLVEIGGELQTRGHKPDGSPWRVAIEKPLPGERQVHKIITIQRDAPLAVMTSGTYRHYFDHEGKRYSHILDARSGRPVQHQTVLVSVLHSDPTQADAWSTALLCLGREAGLAAADQAGIAALFIEGSANGMVEHPSQALSGLEGVEISPQ